MLIGAHVSVAGGYWRGVEYAASVGAECAQIFAKSPRQWRGPAVDPAAADRFASARSDADFGPVFTHAAYLLNLATHDDVLWERSIDALADELARASALQAEGCVTHVGSDRLQDSSRAAARVADAVCRAFVRCADCEPAPRLLLENTAGGGSSFGSTFEQLGEVIRLTGLEPRLLGVCLDTCHAHAFGLTVDSETGWKRLLESIEASVGFDRLGLIHANDCMFAAGERRDRHAWIGDGTIGYDGFRAMFSTAGEIPALKGLAAVTEMPGDPPHKDEENLKRLRRVREEASA